MTRKALINKTNRKPKFSTRKMNRCAITGRGHGYMREFGVSRIVFRELARQGLLPGIKKASW
jgi:small subunit ribosomal protein S14